MVRLLDENSLRAIRTFVNNAIAAAVSTVYKPQGSSNIANLNNLTKSDAMNGYVYDVTNSGDLINQDSTTIHINQGENTVFIWNNGSWYWDVLGGIVDLSNLVPKNNSAQALTGAIKVNVDENGLVIGSSALLASDIPDLSTIYVTTNTSITGATKCKITYDSKGLVTAGADLLASDIPDLSTIYVTTNTSITGATKCKITYDSKGLVTAGADLLASDIPDLSASKITSGTFSDDRIASASTWNAKYTKPSTGIPASDLEESYVTEDTMPIEVRVNQKNTIIVGDALHNVSGKALTAYHAIETTLSGYSIILIKTSSDEPLSREQASSYMLSQTGSNYVPEYNYDHPNNSYFIFSNGKIYKPQYDLVYGLVLYYMSQLAFASDLPEILDYRS